MYLAHQHKQGDICDCRGDHYCCQHQREEHIFPPKLELGEGIAEHGAEEHVQPRNANAQDYRIQKVNREVEIAEEPVIVAQGWCLGDPGWWNECQFSLVL